MRPAAFARIATLILLTLGLPACGSDESGPEESHSPASAKLFIEGVDVTDALTLTAGQTVRAEVKFYSDEGDEITGIEEEHFSALTFTPVGLVTTADVEGEHFQQDLTPQGTVGAGQYTIGYGHDEDADQLTFGPYEVTVAAAAAAAAVISTSIASSSRAWP
jgi:hypothetical protein